MIVILPSFVKDIYQQQCLNQYLNSSQKRWLSLILIYKNGKKFIWRIRPQKNATRSEIKSSYRSLVKQHHPMQAEKRTISCNTKCLGDSKWPYQKKQYDRSFFSSSSSFDSLNENWEEKFNSKNIIRQLKTKKLKYGLKKFTLRSID